MIGEFGVGTYRMYFKKGSVALVYLGLAVLRLYILYKARLLHIFFSFPFCSKPVIIA